VHKINNAKREPVCLEYNILLYIIITKLYLLLVLTVYLKCINKYKVGKKKVNNTKEESISSEINKFTNVLLL